MQEPWVVNESSVPLCLDDPEGFAQELRDTYEECPKEALFGELKYPKLMDLFSSDQTKKAALRQLSPASNRLTGMLNCFMEALSKSDAYQIYMSGIVSELYLVPRCQCFNVVYLMCQRKDCVAVFENGVFPEEVVASENLRCINISRDYQPKLDPSLELEGSLLGIFDDAFIDCQFKNNPTNKNYLQVEYKGKIEYKFMRSNSPTTVALGCGVFRECLENPHYVDFLFAFSEVIKCRNWPSEMTQWFNRKREYGWPGDEIKDEVISSGCQICPNRADAACWEISFARAEQILISTLNPVQQMIYHLLMYFHKTELLRSTTSAVYEISKYDLKTLLLWKCEQSPPSYWKWNAIIPICCNLLRNLASNIENRKSVNYFTGRNIFDSLSTLSDQEYKKTVDEITTELKHRGSSEKYFIVWLDKNYMHKWHLSKHPQPESPNLLYSHDYNKFRHDLNSSP